MPLEESNVFSLSRKLEEAGSDRDLLYKLATIGVNQAWRSYDENSKQLASSFLELDNCVILNMWDGLDKNIKTEFVDRNSDLILEWLKNG
jgi:DNA-directed RNA polymerase specialized sigma subunit